MTLQDRLRRIRFIVCDVDGVLTDGRMWYDGDGKPFRCLHARDGAALTLWRLMDGKTALVTGLGSKAVEAIVAQWQCAELHTFVRDKARVCREMSERHGVPLEEMAFIGDDLIDLPAMRAVGLAVAVADAASEAKAVAHWVTETPGGHGAIREVVYAILSARNELDEAIHRYCSRTDHGQ